MKYHTARNARRWLLAGALLMAAAASNAAVAVNLKFALRGATLGVGGNFPMRTDLRFYDLVPLTDPYGGTVTAASVPVNTVDWVLVELLGGNSAASCNAVVSRPALLQADGSILDPTTLSAPLNFSTVPPGSYNIRIRHRNHAALISTPQALGAAAGAAVDFTQAGTVVNPGNAQVVALGLAAKAGDVNQDGAIDGAPIGSSAPGTDLALVYADAASGSVFQAYVATDLNLDASVDGQDTAALTIQLGLGDLPASPAFPTTGGTAVCGTGIVSTTTAVPVLSPATLASLSALLALTAAGVRRWRDPR